MDTKEYARYHSVMVLTIVIVFGAFLMAHSKEKLRQSSFPEADEAVVRRVFTQGGASYVEIVYKHKGKSHLFTDCIRQKISKGDHVMLYVDPKDPTKVLFNRPCGCMYRKLWFMYFIVSCVCLYAVWTVFV